MSRFVGQAKPFLPTAKNSANARLYCFLLFIFCKNNEKDVEILVTIKSYFSEHEKELLEQTAKEQNISISKLVRKQCEPITNPSYKSLDALLDITKASRHSSERFVKVYLSETEYQQLYKIAVDRKCSLSKIVYEKLYTTSTPIEITYATDDIYELITIITNTYRHLIGVAEGLMRRNIIYERDKELLLTLGYEIRNTLKEYVKQTYRNRNSIRQTAVRHLDRKIEAAINELYS